MGVRSIWLRTDAGNPCVISQVQGFSQTRILGGAPRQAAHLAYAEIMELITCGGPSVRVFRDSASDTDILLYKGWWPVWSISSLLRPANGSTLSGDYAIYMTPSRDDALFGKG